MIFIQYDYLNNLFYNIKSCDLLESKAVMASKSVYVVTTKDST